jgi:hypoxanthine phosphoribosyltransferase
MRLPLLARVLHDTVSDSTRSRVSPSRVRALCKTLAETVSISYHPDIVVAISFGGVTPGEYIAHELSVPVAHLILRRNINIGRMYNKDPIPLRWIMSAYHHFLFHTIKPTVQNDLDKSVAGMKVLIVDDSLHTGATIDIARAYLQAAGAAETRIACLAYVSHRKPDFVALVQGNYSFPWSKDFIPSPEEEASI